MKKWKQKAIVQKTISYLPFPHKINYLFQKYVTKGVYLTDAYFTDRLSHAHGHIQAFRQHASLPLESALELGTGWYPVVPISFFLEGAGTIHSLDISPLCNKKRLLTTIDMFIRCRGEGKLDDFLHVLPERWSVLEEVSKNSGRYDFQGMLKKLRISYLIADARKLPLPDASVSVVTSNNTFEHVYEEVLKDILREFVRITAKGGVMSHFVDMSDHFAHFDRSITIYNYLKYSKAQWKRIDNTIQPQNRLRITDYRKMYQELGIPITQEVCRPGDQEALKTIPLHHDYAHIPRPLLAISHCLLISKIN
jgi:SAM-dependent methyltransferase